MTQARVIAALLAVATVVVAAAIVAGAEYHDDGPEQSQLFDVAFLVVRVGFFILLGLAIGLVVLWLRRDSAKQAPPAPRRTTTARGADATSSGLASWCIGVGQGLAAVIENPAAA